MEALRPCPTRIGACILVLLHAAVGYRGSSPEGVRRLCQEVGDKPPRYGRARGGGQPQCCHIKHNGAEHRASYPR